MRSMAGLFLMLLCPMVVAAQQAPVPQPITFRIAVPFSVSKLHPAITQIQAVCRIGKQNSNGRFTWELLPPEQAARDSSPSTRVPDEEKGWRTDQPGLRDLPVTSGGTYSGSLTLHIAAAIPSTFAGQTGNYECGLQGCREVQAMNRQQAGHACDYLRTILRTDDDPRLLIASPAAPTGRPIVKGTFAW